jgi:hypothetical protein
MADIKKSPRIEVQMAPRVWQKLNYWTKAATGEVSGLGIVSARVEGGSSVVTVDDVFLLKQKCTAANTELDNEDVARLMAELQGRGQLGKLRFWWHSHAHMGVFWSNTDEETRQGFSSEWIVSLVLNKKGEHRLAVDVYRPFPISVDDLTLRLIDPEDAELEAACAAEVKEKVQSHTWTAPDYADYAGYGAYTEEFGEYQSLVQGAQEWKKEKDSLPFDGIYHPLNVAGKLYYPLLGAGERPVRTRAGNIVFMDENIDMKSITDPTKHVFYVESGGTVVTINHEAIRWPYRNPDLSLGGVGYFVVPESTVNPDARGPLRSLQGEPLFTRTNLQGTRIINPYVHTFYTPRDQQMVLVHASDVAWPEKAHDNFRRPVPVKVQP